MLGRIHHVLHADGVGGTRQEVPALRTTHRIDQPGAPQAKEDLLNVVVGKLFVSASPGQQTAVSRPACQVEETISPYSPQVVIRMGSICDARCRDSMAAASSRYPNSVIARRSRIFLSSCSVRSPFSRTSSRTVTFLATASLASRAAARSRFWRQAPSRSRGCAPASTRSARRRPRFPPRNARQRRSWRS